MDEKRKSQPWGLWCVAILAAPLLYIVSAGPAHWLDTRGCLDPTVRHGLMIFYTPLQFMVRQGPTPVRDAILWYGRLWGP